MAAADNRRDVMRQSAIVLAFGWLLAPLQFLTAVIVARAVGPDGKGALALLTGLTAILVSLGGLGIPSGAAALYRRDDYPEPHVIATALAVTLMSSMVLALATLAGGAPLLSTVLPQRELANIPPAWILLALAAVPPAALAAVIDVLLIAANAMRLYALRSAVSGLAGIAITWLLTVILGWGVAGALVSYPVAAIVGFAFFAYWWIRQIDRPPLQFSVACARALLHVGVQQQALAIIALVAKRFDVFLIASMLTLQDAGFYAAAILIPQAIVSIPRSTMWPLVSAMSSEGGEVSEVVARISRLQVLLMVVIAAALYALAPIIILGLFGSAFSPSIAPFRWALLGVPFTPLTITVNAILTARRRPGLSIAAAFAGTSTQLIVMILLLERWGASAAAAALSVNFIVTAVLQLVVARRQGVPVTQMVVAKREDVGLLVKRVRGYVRR